MLRGSIAYTANSPIFRTISLNQIAIVVGWSRQLTIQLMVLLVGIFYTCAVLEVDLGETGDSFGDVFDSYVPSTPIQAPKTTAVVYRDKLPVAPITDLYKRPLLLGLSVDAVFLVALAPVAFFVYKPFKRRPLQVLHAIWQL